MNSLPDGWRERFTRRPKDKRAYYGWADGPARTITYYLGPWLLGLFWLRRHERMHAHQFERQGRMWHCGDRSCVMCSRNRVSWWRMLCARRKRGGWYCGECAELIRRE